MTYSNGSRISGKEVGMFKGKGVRFVLLSHFCKISHDNKIIRAH